MALASIEGARPHDFRRAFASVGLGSGLSLDQLGALLGHGRAETTKGYAFLQPDPARPAVPLIGEGIKAAGRRER
jgi:site-specific recombinase XerD